MNIKFLIGGKGFLCYVSSELEEGGSVCLLYMALNGSKCSNVLINFNCTWWIIYLNVSSSLCHCFSQVFIV